MKTIDKDELYNHLCDFLKAKGVELRPGSYSERIRQGCSLLADVANTTRKTVRRAKAKAGQTLDDLRQTIHEATAPAPAPAKTGAVPPKMKKNPKAASAAGSRPGPRARK